MNGLKILARGVEHGGHTYGLSYIEILQNSQRIWEVFIAPFERETPGTAYYSGTILIRSAKDSSLPYSPSTEAPLILKK